MSKVAKQLLLVFMASLGMLVPFAVQNAYADTVTALSATTGTESNTPPITNTSLTETAGHGGDNSVAQASSILPGTTLNFNTGFNASENHNYIVWTTVDIRDVTYSNGSLGGTAGGSTGACPNVDPSPGSAYYNSGSTHFTCNNQGLSIQWTTPSQSSGNYALALTVANGLDPADQTFCVRTHVSQGTLSNVVSISQRLCYNIAQQVVSGKINFTGTAPSLPNGVVGSFLINRSCSGGGNDPSTLSDQAVSNGQNQSVSNRYGFVTHRGSPFCISAPTNFTYGGITYRLITAQTYNFQVAGYACQTQLTLPGDNSCANASARLLDHAGDDTYNFTYTPTLGCSGNCIPVGGKVTDSVGGEGIGGLAIYEAQDMGSCEANGSGPGSGGAWFTDANGNYSERLVKGAHFCLVAQSEFTQNGYPATGYHYKNPLNTINGGASLGGQVAGMDCRSYGDTSEQGRLCTGWGSGGQDNSHIGAETASTYDGGCAGGSNIGYTTAARTSPYASNEACGQTRTLKSYTGDDKHKVTSHDNYTKRRHIGGSSGNEDGSCSHYSGPHSCTDLAEDHDGPLAGRCPGAFTPTSYPTRCINDPTNENERDGLCSGSYDYAGHGQACTNTSTRTSYSQDEPSLNCDNTTAGHYSGATFVSCHDTHTVVKQPYATYPYDIADGDAGVNNINWTYDPYVTIAGYAYNSTSDPDKYYNNDQITACNVGTTYTGTDGTPGHYSFEVIRRGLYCVRDQSYPYDPDTGQALDGPFINTAYQPIGKSYENQATDTSRLNVDFRYQNPTVTNNGGGVTQKHVYSDPGRTNQIDGQNVKPGQTLYYTITVSNNGDDTTNLMLEDFIPQNIDPGTLDWSSNGNGWSGMPLTSYGYNANPGERAYDCSACNNPKAPGYIYAFAANVPGAHTNPNSSYSLTVKWSGKVRDASTVGVFPSNYSYCANPGDWSTRGDTTTHTDDYYDPSSTRRGSSCENYPGGLQAVVNFARVGYHYATDGSYSGNFSGWGVSSTGAADGRGGAVTAAVTNPIPGNISCIGKTFGGNARWDDGSQTHATDTCGNPTGAGQVVFNKDPYYNSGTVQLSVNYDNTMGPVEYGVFDQYKNGAVQQFNTIGGVQEMTYANGSENPTNSQFTEQFSNNTNNPLGPLSWTENKTFKNSTALAGATSRNSYSFDVKFDQCGTLCDSVAVDNQICNQAGISWVDYSNPAHPTNTAYSSNVCAKKVGISRPYVSTDNGGVYTGGGVLGTSCTLGGLSVTPTNGLKGAGTLPSQGRYIVATTGTISNWNARSGDTLSQIGTPICRPNAVSDVANAPSSIKVTTTAPQGTSSLYPASNPALDGKIVTRDGDFTLGNNDGSPIKIYNRTTLYVHGNLYIKSNIVYNTAATTLSTTPSFGVVVDGNIYIDPSVTQLAGFYYAGTLAPAQSTAQGGTQNVGKITTCARPNGAMSNPATDTWLTLNSGLNAAACSNRLAVNGFMQAYAYRFLRTAIPATTSCNTAVSKSTCIQQNASETVTLDPRFYLVTPPGFSTSTSLDNRTLYGGEQAPRY